MERDSRHFRQTLSQRLFSATCLLAACGHSGRSSPSLVDASQPDAQSTAHSTSTAPDQPPPTAARAEPTHTSGSSLPSAPSVPAASVAVLPPDAGQPKRSPVDGGHDSGPIVSSSTTVAVDGASAAELLEECGVAPDGLAPRFVEVDATSTAGVKLSLAIQGDPKHAPVVLVHGFPDFWCGWARVIPLLASRYFVVAPDMRGYNRSSKPGNPDNPQDLADYRLSLLSQDIADIVHYTAMQTQQKVALVAHDWGAIVSWPSVHQYPEDIAKFMAISVAHPQAMAQFMASTDPALREAQAAQAQALTYVTQLVMDDSPRYYGENNYQRLFESLDTKHLQDPTKFPEPERAAYRRMWDADGQASFKSQIKYYRANFGPTGQTQAGDLTTPHATTFVAPIHDGALLYPHNMDYMREHIAATEPLTLRPIDSGHFPQREEPARMSKMIEQFVDTTSELP